MDKKIIIGSGVLMLVAVLGWAYWESVKPMPGTLMPDLGREHIEKGKIAEYNSNPPTSGSHYTDWTKAGVYDNPLDDRNLLHSLEHGYVIMSYNCDSKGNELGVMSNEATGSGDLASESAKLSDSFQSEDCKKLVDNLRTIYDRKGKRKLIVIPRPNLDAQIGLTAWTRVDKFTGFDQKRIENFIDKLRDRGPEQTME